MQSIPPSKLHHLPLTVQFMVVQDSGDATAVLLHWVLLVHFKVFLVCLELCGSAVHFNLGVPLRNSYFFGSSVFVLLYLKGAVPFWRCSQIASGSAGVLQR